MTAAAAPTGAPAPPLSFRMATATTRFVQLIALTLVCLLFFGVLAAVLNAQLAPRVPPDNLTAPRLTLAESRAFLVLLLCTLPPILMGVATSRVNQQIGMVRARRLVLPEAPAPLPSGWTDDRWRTVVSRADTLWRDEQSRLTYSLQRVRELSILFGVLCTLSLVSAALIALPAFVSVGALGALELAAVALGAATAVRFAYTLKLVLVRASHRDLTARTITWAIAELVTAQVSAIFCSGVASELRGTPAGSCLSHALLGVAVGVFGARVLEALKDQAAERIGVRKEASRDIPLTVIQGLTDEDITRLREEGIHSVHGLAFTPTPRLFFHTSYSLPQICDLQAQAFLAIYLDVPRMQALWQETMGRSALDTGFLERLLAPGAIAGRGEAVMARIGLRDLEHLQGLLDVLLHHELVQRLRVFWQACPEGAPPESEAA